MYGIKLIVFHSIYCSLLESSARRNGIRDAHLFLAPAQVHARGFFLFGVVKRKRKTVQQIMRNVSEALAELPTPPRSPVLKAKNILERAFEDPLSGVSDFDRPFCETIVDGCIRTLTVFE